MASRTYSPFNARSSGISALGSRFLTASALGLRPAVVQQLLRGYSTFRDKGKAVHPIERRRKLSHPQAGERGSQQSAQAQDLPG